MTTSLQELAQQLEVATQNHLGYPYTLRPTPPELLPFLQFSLNNLGESRAPSRYAISVHAQERAVIDYFVQLWRGEPAQCWGTVTSSGTEGNLLGILYGREAAGPGAALLTSVEAHYSVNKAARMYAMECTELPSSQQGELDYEALTVELNELAEQERGAVIVVNAGSTVLGGHDRLSKVEEAIAASALPRRRCYVHVDAALSGLITPFLDAPDYQFSFAGGADSIAVSGHKQMGIAVPCGVLCCRDEHMLRWAQGTPAGAAYVTRRDATLSGSRGGFAALALWHAIHSRSSEFAAEAQSCVRRAQAFAAHMVAAAPSSEARVVCPVSTTVVFRRPAEAVCTRYQLACTDSVAHIVITPSVREETLSRFLKE